VKRAIDAIGEDAWTSIDYTDRGEAWVAETSYGDWPDPESESSLYETSASIGVQLFANAAGVS
jgi:hypothetical protein